MRHDAARGLILALVTVVCAGAAEPRFKLYDPGTEEIIDYLKYGTFVDPGTTNFHYVVKDSAGLARASGEGIDPCLSITNNPDFRKAKEQGRLKADWWKRVNTSDPQLDYFAWANSAEDPGVRLLFVGKALEKGGHLMHALKAYRAAIILYPDAACWSAGAEFQWDVATAAWNAIQNLLRKHPDLGVRLVGADVTARPTPAGMAIVVSPGRIEKIGEPASAAAEADAQEEEAPADVVAEDQEAVEEDGAGDEEGEAEEETAAAVETADVEPLEEQVGDPDEEFTLPVDADAVLMTRGTGMVQFVQYGNHDWKMFVNGERYFVYGMNYAPVKVGAIPWEWNWVWSDENTNGIVDSLEVWLDADGDGQQGGGEPTTSDYQLMKDMGVNTIKFYLTDPELAAFNRLLMRKMFADTGIRAIVGNFLGAYCNGSGADWDQGTDYTNRKQKENMRASVSNLVMKLKGEPWVLAWVLGNENNMEMSGDVNATRTNASKYPDTYSRFLNEVAKMIHELDPDHPVGVGNLLTGLVEYYGKSAPALDFIGVNSYLGEDGFGATWQKIRMSMNRPVVITEFGCDSYYTGKGSDEAMQATYLVKNWEDIYFNRAGGGGAGNSIGGFIFEWLDEWWKDTINYFEDSPAHQTTRAVFPMPFPDGYAQEEWFGLLGQGAGNASPFQRVPKQAYYAIQKLWQQELSEGKEGVTDVVP